MILVDTNVISELWKTPPDEKVMAWMDNQIVESLYLSSITVAELRYGIAVLPEGKRKSIYKDRLNNEVLKIFFGRVLAFDIEAAEYYSRIMAIAKAKGQAIGREDGYIAAIATSNDFSVATCDTSPFIAAGVNVINPWNT